MHNLDDLIQNISNDEIRDVPGKLSAEQQRRIESKILSELPVVTVKRRSFRKRMVIALAAVLILLIGLTAVAATENEWDIAITNFMGLNDPSTLQLESGEVKINATASDNGLTITDITSIGDKNSAYIRIDTDYKLPDDFDEAKDYILPENYAINISETDVGKPKTYASTLTCFYEDGYLGFLLELSNCIDLNKSYVSIGFENLILHHDLHVYDDSAPEEELLLEGNWNLNWKYSYKSSTQIYHTLKKIKVLNNNVWITTIDISPISIRLEGKRAFYNYTKSWDGAIGNAEIVLKDGTILSDIQQSVGGYSNTTFEYYLDLHSLHQTINPDELDYIILENQRIDF